LNEREVASPSPQFDDEKLQRTRYDLAQLLHEVCAVALEHKIDDPAFIKQVIKDIYSVTCFRNKSFTKHLDVHDKVFHYNKKAYFRSFNEKTHYPRSLMIATVHTLMTSRYFFRRMPFVGVHEKLLQDLQQLSMASYSRVRAKAQNVYVNLLKLFHPRLARRLLPSIIEVLEKANPSDEELNGAIYILQSRTPIKRITEDWGLLSQFLLAISRCSNVEKPTVQTRLHQLFVTYSHAYKELRLDWPRPPGTPAGTLVHAD
jgi:hypothetical protein